MDSDLSVTEVSIRLGVSRQTVWKYLKSGLLEFRWEVHGLLRRAAIKEASVIAFEARQEELKERA